MTTNNGISHTGTGDLTMTNSHVSLGGGHAKPTPLVAHGGTGRLTVNGQPVRPTTARGNETINIGPHSDGASEVRGGFPVTYRAGVGDGAPLQSRWTDAPPSGGTGGGGEFQDHASIRRFVEEIAAFGDGSDFVQIIKACADVHEAVRDFGGDVNRDVAAFAEAATAVAALGEQLRDQAAQIALLSRDLSGEG